MGGCKSFGKLKCKLCNNIAIGRMLCRSCYYKERHLGRLHLYPFPTPSDTFMLRVNKIASGCWEWSGTRNNYGYGIILEKGEKPIRAHRFSYELFVGKIPDGMVIMHTCDNPPCVNPEHLKLGTKLDNNRDAHKKGRRPNGEKSHFAKLTESQVISILNDTRKQFEIAKDYNVGQDHISRIKSGKQWKHLHKP